MRQREGRNAAVAKAVEGANATHATRGVAQERHFPRRRGVVGGAVSGEGEVQTGDTARREIDLAEIGAGRTRRIVRRHIDHLVERVRGAERSANDAVDVVNARRRAGRRVGGERRGERTSAAGQRAGIRVGAARAVVDGAVDRGREAVGLGHRLRGGGQGQNKGGSRQSSISKFHVVLLRASALV